MSGSRSRPGARERAALLALGLATLGAATGCREGGGLGPVSRAEVAATYVALTTEGTRVVADTVYLDATGYGSWSSTGSSTIAAFAPYTVYRFLEFEMEGALLVVESRPGCGPAELCVRPEEYTAMRGIVRGDTLTLWYAGEPPQDGPSWYRFARASSAP